jgi:hypothetical protein
MSGVRGPAPAYLIVYAFRHREVVHGVEWLM